MNDNINKYFPLLTSIQRERFTQLSSIYGRWNSMINVISRKDMENFVVHHLLHSLAIAKVISFFPGTKIIDVGTGGGFPGIPLAILFPEAEFTLLDSIEKKIKVVSAVTEELGLENVIPLRKRIEEEKGKYHFVISRAVTEFPAFVNLTSKNISGDEKNILKNGILYLKGGDLSAEIEKFQNRVRVYEISNFFEEPFFETKKIIHLSF